MRLRMVLLAMLFFPAVAALSCDLDFDAPIEVSLEQLRICEASSDDCHEAAHELGHVARERVGIGSALALDGHVCRSGFVHGLFEGADDLDGSLCDGLKRTARDQCLHGFGHGLMMSLDIESARQVCDELSAYDASSCRSGVAMQFLTQDANVSRCSFPECRTYLAWWADERDVEVECADPLCQYGYGVHLVRSSDFSVEHVLESCEDRACVRGAASEFAYNGEPLDAIHFCFRARCVLPLADHLAKHLTDVLWWGV